MKIEKVLNNNVAVTRDEKGREVVVMGRGLAFQSRIGDIIKESSIEKTFTINDEGIAGKFQQLMASIPMSHMLLSERIINYARINLGKKLNDSIYVTLPDHISTAILRYKEGIVLKNPLLWDIRRFYKDEYAIGLKANQIVLEETGVQFCDDEAAFIALHFVNAQLGDEIGTMYDLTYIIQEMCSIVRTFFNMEFDEESLDYYRFITHAKFFAQRVLNGVYYEDDSQDLLEVIQFKYPDAYACAVKIGDFIMEKYQYSCKSEEMLYMTAHIARLSRKAED
ncbi:MAG: PRD domain-containing protein [Pygmaiobacter sp.]